MKRRDFLRAALVTASAAAIPACVDESVVLPKTKRTLEDGAAYFPQSLASGDPQPDAVILWTRVFDPERAAEDLSLALEVSFDEEFAELVELEEAQSVLTAEAAFDHCVKVRLAGLDPATTYYYRFIYAQGGKNWVSHPGRTKTAPDPEDDAKVRFAFVSCQDFIGRYYNAYAALAGEEIDFFVHLGDYVYETTGDPTFQEQAGDRKVVFTDQKGAIALTAGDGKTFYAAKSLDNYRELYRTYRSDPVLQTVHELFPMIATWDDHEYSDDCHGAVATYYDGRQDETDVDRRKAANQAWSEYMPVDFPDAPDFRYDPAASYPDDITIYRDFVFGKHLHLVMTDLRTYRADHLIPEEAFPGTVVADQAALTAALGTLPDIARPYVDVETYQAGVYKDALVAAATDLGYDAKNVTGKLAVSFINGLIDDINAGKPPADQIPPIDEAAQATLEKGLAYIDLGKGSFYGAIGARYLIVKDALDIVATLQYESSQGASQEVLGPDQKKWFLETMKGSESTWKVWGNEYCLTQLAIDLRTQDIPEAFQRRFYMNCDAWDGFRDERSALLAELSGVGNVVAITGDVHAFYASTPMTNDDPEKKIVEFVTSSITSKTFRDELKEQVAGDPTLSAIPQAGALAAAIDVLFTDTTTKINPQLAYAKSGSNGFVIVEAGPDELLATTYEIPAKKTLTDLTAEGGVADEFEQQRFRTLPGAADLYKDFDGTWKKWDLVTLSFV